MLLKMKTFIQSTVCELIKRARSDILMGWRDWEPSVNDLISVHEYTGGDSTEFRQARDAAVKAVTHLKSVTHRVSNEIENKLKM